MKFLNKLTSLFMVALLCGSSLGFTSCNDDDDDFGTQQFVGGVHLNSYGPSPVARGGELRFIGSGMDQIQSIEIPGCDPVTDIRVIDRGEIRITVPQTALEGKLVLNYKNGKITTMTGLTYLEPVSLDEFSPAIVKPGDVLTIKGEYLNIMHEVIFTDGVSVDEENFITHTRNEISLVVPEDAQTGKIIISDGAEEMPNWIYSEEDLTVILPSVDAVQDLTKIKPGAEITVAGKDLGLVRSIEMPNGDTVEFTLTEDGKIKFTLPANVTDGTIVMIPASGVKVAVATIGVAVPEDVVADPAVNIWGGDIIKFKGVNMELVTSVTFPGVENAVTDFTATATEITVTVPEGTQSGDAVLSTASGAEVAVAVSTLKPEAVGFNPVPAPLAGDLTVKGRNLANVTAIIFAGTEVEVKNPTDGEFSVVVPATLAAGVCEVSLKLSNNEVVDGFSVELSAPECAYATALPGDEDEVRAGEICSITIANGEKLTAVQVNGQNVQYILNGTTLMFQIPQAAGKNSTLTLVSDNGQISYDLAVIPATHVGLTIWEGMWQPEGWAGNQDLAWGGYDWSQAPAGAKLTIHFTPVDASQWYFFGLRHGDGWGELPGNRHGQVDNPEGGTVSFELNAEELADLVANGGLVIVSQNTVMNKVTIEWEVSLETVIWNAGWVCTGWAGNQDLAWGGYDWSTVKPGQILRLYTTPTLADGEWWCLSLRHGDGWANLPDPIPAQYDNPASPLEVVLTADVIADLVANGGLVITGSEYQLDKITLE